jgi:hypothetical protein
MPQQLHAASAGANVHSIQFDGEAKRVPDRVIAINDEYDVPASGHGPGTFFRKSAASVRDQRSLTVPWMATLTSRKVKTTTSPG